jgi:alpha-ketoglutarate-dependent 2,4-dichlorophenoxyacetate dioxygenase
MALEFRKLQPLFAAEASPIDLRNVHDEATLEEIRRGMDEYGVLVFRDQPFTDDDQLAFARRFDGELHTKTGLNAIAKNRFGKEALTDISNIDAEGNVVSAGDRRRFYALGNRLWHTDASFQDPPGRYSLLNAKVIPPVDADTEFADMYAAYEALSDERKAQLAGLRVHHSIAHSREKLGFEFSPAEQDLLKGAVHPLVRTNPNTGRKSLYIAAHASMIIDWPVPEGRMFIWDLMEHATKPQFVYRHKWRVGDLVIWDNRATMHRGTPYDDTKHRRELRRVTTLDLPRHAAAA